MVLAEAADRQQRRSHSAAAVAVPPAAAVRAALRQVGSVRAGPFRAGPAGTGEVRPAPGPARSNRPAVGEEEEEEEGSKAVMRMGKKRQKRKKNRGWLRRLAMSRFLDSLVTGVIVANTVTMAMVHDRESVVGAGWRSDVQYLRFSALLELVNLVFSAVFMAELVIKLVGMGTDAIRGDSLLWPSAPLAYFRSGFNLFDFTIVIVTSLEIPSTTAMVLCRLRATDLQTCEASSSGLSVLRMCRLLRLVRLLRSFPTVQKQVFNLARIARPAASQAALFFLYLLVLSIMGVSLFGGRLAAAPSSLSNVCVGARAFVHLPDDPIPPDVAGRPAVILSVNETRGGAGRIQARTGPVQAHVHAPVRMRCTGMRTGAYRPHTGTRPGRPARGATRSACACACTGSSSVHEAAAVYG